MRWNRQPRKLVLFGGIALVVAFGVLCVLTPYFDEEYNRSRRCRGLMNPVIEAALQLRQDGEMLPFTSDGRLNLFELAPEVCSDKDFAENVFFNENLSKTFLIDSEPIDPHISQPWGICDHEGVRFGKENSGKVVYWKVVYWGSGNGVGYRMMTTKHIRELLKRLKKPQIDAE